MITSNGVTVNSELDFYLITEATITDFSQFSFPGEILKLTVNSVNHLPIKYIFSVLSCF